MYDLNPEYWNPAVQGVERVTVTGVPDNNARMNALLTGEADIMATTRDAQIQTGLDGGMAGSQECVGRVSANMAVGQDLVPHTTTQKIVNGHTQSLGLDVVEGDVHRSNRRRQYLARREEPGPPHHLPQVLDPHRILANQARRQCGDHLRNGPLAGCDSRLADPHEAAVNEEHLRAIGYVE